MDDEQIWTKYWSRKSPRPIKKGNIRYLLNERLSLTPANLLDIFESHGIARKKLRNELQLFMQGEKDALRFFYFRASFIRGRELGKSTFRFM